MSWFNKGLCGKCGGTSTMEEGVRWCDGCNEPTSKCVCPDHVFKSRAFR